MDGAEIASVATFFSAFITAIGVGVAAFQIRESRKLSQATFENGIDQQYRKLSMIIPVDALIGRTVNGKEAELREILYNYLDLCNEQIYLRQKNRISFARWQDWNTGIKENLSKPAFKMVWDEVKKEAPNTFTSLERLEKDGFKTDPFKWD